MTGPRCIFGDGVFGADSGSRVDHQSVLSRWRWCPGQCLVRHHSDHYRGAATGSSWVREVTNPRPATGGAERESIAHAVSHAPQVFRSLKRAVTAQDYEALALDFKGVGKVLAEGTSWNVVTLFVAPAGGGHVSDVLEANLLAYFEDKRPVSTIIEIEDVDYVPIYVTAEVGVKSYLQRR